MDYHKLLNDKYILCCWRYETTNRIKASRIQKVINRYTKPIKQYLPNGIIDNTELSAKLNYLCNKEVNMYEI